LRRAESGTGRRSLRKRLGRRHLGSNDEPVFNNANFEDADQRSVDALDYYGLWKLFDGLCDAAFYGKNRQDALGNTPEQRFMGKWSDGKAVKGLKVMD
jgi:hypothetical protein